MKKIEKEVNGRKFAFVIRDIDDEKDAEKIGIPQGPPDVDLIPWDQVATDLHNALYDTGILRWDDIQGKPGAAIPAVCQRVLKKHVINLLKQTRRSKDGNI